MTITLPDEMQKALQEASQDENRPIAAIIRIAIAKYLLEAHNVKVEPAMKWGGGKGRTTDSDGE